jgi:hypothetical protein
MLGGPPDALAFSVADSSRDLAPIRALIQVGLAALSDPDSAADLDREVW